MKLQRCYEKFTQAARKWGEEVARRYIDRVNILYAAESIADLHTMTVLRFHALKGNRAGQYALWLTERMRLIVSFPGTDQKSVCVEEVSKHYDD